MFFNCEENLEEFNIDPTRPTSTTLPLALPEVLASSQYNEGGNQARVAGIFMQQYEGIDAQQLQYTTYVLQENTMNNYWRTGLYGGVLKSCQVINELAAEGDFTFYSGVSKIMMANQYGLGTAYFGDLPFTGALQGQDGLKPAYDSQESIYAAVLAMLDDAIADLGTATGYTAGDLIYNGDAAAWIKTAHGLKARYYLHLSKRDASNYGKALSSLALSYADASEQANFTFDDTDIGNWSIAAFSSERGGTLGMDQNFVSMMSGDPREGIIFEGGAIDGFWTRNDATIPVISYAELKFIEAECLLETGGMDADVAAALGAGINANMATVGATDTIGYVTSATDMSGLDAAGKKDRIITEAYKAYFGYNFHETWSNWRRTGYPALTAKADGSNGANPSGQIPQRYLYVSSESSTNSANVEAAKAAQGGALMDATLWVFE